MRRQLKALPLEGGLPLVGLGGNLRAIARLDQRCRRYPLDLLHGYYLSRQGPSSRRRCGPAGACAPWETGRPATTPSPTALLDLALSQPDRRLPELVGGFPREEGLPPVPYPVACRPQAWDAASVVYLYALTRGLRTW